MTSTPTAGTNGAQPIVRIRDLTKAFGDHVVLSGINLDVMPGEVLCIIGPSGSGKSTLVRCVNHLEDPTRGFVEVDGELVGRELHRGRVRRLPLRRLRKQRLATGMVFQSFNLFTNMSALDNVATGPRKVLGLGKDEANALAREQIARVGLAGREETFPRQLSGGQQQRIAIARALAMHPKVMLFDEPTSALDPELVGEVLAVIRGLAESGMTMMIVTHEIDFAHEIADRVVMLHDGELVEDGPPSQVLENPRHDRTATFLQRYLRDQTIIHGGPIDQLDGIDTTGVTP